MTKFKPGPTECIPEKEIIYVSGAIKCPTITKVAGTIDKGSMTIYFKWHDDDHVGSSVHLDFKWGNGIDKFNRIIAFNELPPFIVVKGPELIGLKLPVCQDEQGRILWPNLKPEQYKEQGMPFKPIDYMTAGEMIKLLSNYSSETRIEVYRNGVWVKPSIDYTCVDEWSGSSWIRKEEIIRIAGKE